MNDACKIVYSAVNHRDGVAGRVSDVDGVGRGVDADADVDGVSKPTVTVDMLAPAGVATPNAGGLGRILHQINQSLHYVECWLQIVRATIG